MRPKVPKSSHNIAQCSALLSAWNLDSKCPRKNSRLSTDTHGFSKLPEAKTIAQINQNRQIMACLFYMIWFAVLQALPSALEQHIKREKCPKEPRREASLCRFAKPKLQEGGREGGREAGREISIEDSHLVKSTKNPGHVAMSPLLGQLMSVWGKQLVHWCNILKGKMRWHFYSWIKVEEIGEKAKGDVIVCPKLQIRNSWEASSRDNIQRGFSNFVQIQIENLLDCWYCAGISSGNKHCKNCECCPVSLHS